ncbi:Abhydrolase, bacterial [Gemmatirosa kalamazoonensis]|uniref:Abhydrolase, bacterial n=1 Tax=Gemmatirosa kalamazoonensis TaxID=861299 RepID=W0RQ42_9BACT|nr:alpha/beta hydrolase family protein [Gemmatirosa kalamazoonensis]AHG91633.1 Abhydrolase, bacterial [Gemmatirosa kalamazoonensis]
MQRREFLKHGTMAGALAATGNLAGARAASAEPTADVAPTELEARLDSQAFCLAAYDDITPAHAFRATDAASAKRWQRRARQRLLDRIGGLPTTRVPLNAEVVSTADFGGYTREKVVFDTRAHLSAVGYLLLPTEGRRPLPAIVALPGHGRGVADIMGFGVDETPSGQRGVGYAKEYALQCVEHGYAVLALEQLGFGMRRDAAARRAGPTENSCRPAACAALLFGQSMLGWRVWDAMRAIDYLQSRPEVDGRRIATLGASSGGTTSLFTAALDGRVKAAVVSAYFNTFRDSIVQISHCPDNYVPGLLHDMEMADVAGLVAPRALFVESGRADHIFPIAGFDRAAATGRRIYDAFGATDRFGSAVHDGGHEFNGVAAFQFLSRTL